MLWGGGCFHWGYKHKVRKFGRVGDGVGVTLSAVLASWGGTWSV